MRYTKAFLDAIQTFDPSKRALCSVSGSKVRFTHYGVFLQALGMQPKAWYGGAFFGVVVKSSCAAEAERALSDGYATRKDVRENGDWLMEITDAGRTALALTDYFMNPPPEDVRAALIRAAEEKRGYFDSAEYWHAWGPIRGGCGHFHRFWEDALECALDDGVACREQGGYSDRHARRLPPRSAGLDPWQKRW